MMRMVSSYNQGFSYSRYKPVLPRSPFQQDHTTSLPAGSSPQFGKVKLLPSFSPITLLCGLILVGGFAADQKFLNGYVLQTIGGAVTSGLASITKTKKPETGAYKTDNNGNIEWKDPETGRIETSPRPSMGPSGEEEQLKAELSNSPGLLMLSHTYSLQKIVKTYNEIYPDHKITQGAFQKICRDNVENWDKIPKGTAFDLTLLPRR